MVTHPSTNRTQHRVTSLIRPAFLPTAPNCQEQQFSAVEKITITTGLVKSNRRLFTMFMITSSDFLQTTVKSSRMLDITYITNFYCLAFFSFLRKLCDIAILYHDCCHVANCCVFCDIFSFCILLLNWCDAGIERERLSFVYDAEKKQLAYDPDVDRAR